LKANTVEATNAAGGNEGIFPLPFMQLTNWLLDRLSFARSSGYLSPVTISIYAPAPRPVRITRIHSPRSIPVEEDDVKVLLDPFFASLLRKAGNLNFDDWLRYEAAIIPSEGSVLISPTMVILLIATQTYY
jgi:hypothetical protein